MQSSQPSQLQQQRSQQDRLSRSTHDQVSSIFKLISEKDTAKQGLLKLHEFKEQNPDVDINPFLRGASAYFQQYINDGLAEIQRMSQNNTNNNNNTNANNTKQDVIAGGDTIQANRINTQIANGDGRSPDFWMERLNMYRVRAKLPNSEQQQEMDNKMADENLNLNQIQRLTTLSRKDVS